MPTPNHPGMIWRDWVQPNTHGIARRSSIPEPAADRRAGREPMFIADSSSTGVDVVEVLDEPGTLEEAAVRRVRARADISSISVVPLGPTVAASWRGRAVR